MAWDWDTYFNSGSQPGPERHDHATPPGARHLRLVQEMDGDGYFDPDSAPGQSPAVQGRGAVTRIRAVRSIPSESSAT
ncbi:hypothetical protein ACWF9B_35450 [Streptomyces sp. NPDC055089]